MRRIMKETSPRALIFGDIAIRTKFGPCSFLLWRARRRRFVVASGSDPLPMGCDLDLVGSFGMQVRVDSEPTLETIFSDVIEPALLGDIPCVTWGQRNGVLRALRRVCLGFSLSRAS